MNTPITVLVTGASGVTGGATVRELLQRGVKVRAFVHKLDERSDQLAALGAEIAQGDLLDFRSIRAALEGVNSAYFVFPVISGIVQATGYFAQASTEVGLEAIVNMSQVTARRDAVSNASRDHWIAERLFDRSGIPVTHLRPTVFAEWLIYFAARIPQLGFLALPFGDMRQAFIAAEDQARVIAAILLDPAPHKGQIYPLYGADEVTFAEAVAVISELLNQPVGYRLVDIDAFEKAVLASGKDAFLAQHLRAVAMDHSNGLFTGNNDLVERITGRPPLTVREFVSKHKQLFTPSAILTAAS
jgi:NAD(P)H dehydrogenase (quinone)